MSNLEPRRPVRPIAMALPRATPMNLLRLGLATLACLLCARAVAQQAPLTGHMLGGQTPVMQTTPAQTTHAKPATPSVAQPATPSATPSATQPATASTPTPWHAQQPSADHQLPASTPAPAPPTQPTPMPTPAAPMPAYTDLRAPVPSNTPSVTTQRRQRPAFGTRIGASTRNLLSMQANNTRAVATLPTLGAEASAAYARYLQSFHHPIPVFFKHAVKSSSNTGSGGGQ